MSLGVYNPKYFQNHPKEADKPGLLYCVVLVNKATFEREAIKIGITKGSNYKDAIKRSGGFTGYDIRIQKLVKGTLEEVFYLEQHLHDMWSHKRLEPSVKFGGHTECFEMDPEIIRSVPKEV